MRTLRVISYVAWVRVVGGVEKMVIRIYNN